MSGIGKHILKIEVASAIIAVIGISTMVLAGADMRSTVNSNTAAIESSAAINSKSNGELKTILAEHITEADARQKEADAQHKDDSLHREQVRLLQSAITEMRTQERLDREQIRLLHISIIETRSQQALQKEREMRHTKEIKAELREVLEAVQ